MYETEARFPDIDADKLEQMQHNAMFELLDYPGRHGS